MNQNYRVLHVNNEHSQSTQISSENVKQAKLRASSSTASQIDEDDINDNEET